MRQIHVCACFLLALTACGGGEFSTPASGGQRGSENRAGSSSAAGSSAAISDDPAPSASGGAASVGGRPANFPQNGGRSSDDNAGGAGDDTSSTPGGSAAGAASEDCPSGAITFRMLPSSKLEPESLCDAGCGTGWLSITDKDGATGFPISSACGTASCEACEVRQCAAAACLATPLTARGSELVWDGSYLAKDSCGASKLVCQRRACVKPGKYKAKACAAVSAGASPGGGCMPKEARLCKEVEFEFPATGSVEIELGG